MNEVKSLFDFEPPLTGFETIVICQDCGWQGAIGELCDDLSGWDEYRYCPKCGEENFEYEEVEKYIDVFGYFEGTVEE